MFYTDQYTRIRNGQAKTCCKTCYQEYQTSTLVVISAQLNIKVCSNCWQAMKSKNVAR